MIMLSNRHSFEYMAASGALGYDGQGWPWEQPLRIPGLLHHDWQVFEPKLFTAVTKTLTPHPTKGNRFDESVRFIRDGVVNAVALNNPGFGWWCERVEPKLPQSKVPNIVSITAQEIEQLELMAGRLENSHIVGIEFNASCPNTDAILADNGEFIVAGCRAIKARVPHIPLLLKLSVVHRAEEILPRVFGLVEAISINSVPWKIMYPENHPWHESSPLAHLGGGGVSGGAAQQMTWGYARHLHAMTSIPIIGPSIWLFEDMAALRAQGMKALSFGSIWLRYPWRPTLYVRRDRIMTCQRWDFYQKHLPHHV